MREVFLGSPWGGRSCLVLLLVPLLLFGCTRELEEKLAGKERELSDIQTALSEVQDKLARLLFNSMGAILAVQERVAVEPADPAPQ